MILQCHQAELGGGMCARAECHPRIQDDLYLIRLQNIIFPHRANDNPLSYPCCVIMFLPGICPVLFKDLAHFGKVCSQLSQLQRNLLKGGIRLLEVGKITQNRDMAWLNHIGLIDSILGEGIMLNCYALMTVRLKNGIYRINQGYWNPNSKFCPRHGGPLISCFRCQRRS